MQIKCLNIRCDKLLIEEEISKYIGDQVFQKFLKFKNEQNLLSNPNKKFLHCPFPDCGMMIEIINDLTPKTWTNKEF